MEGARDTRGWKKCWCLLAVLFWAPYLQHNLYHTTLFAAFGAKGFWMFALFSASLAVALVSAVLFHTAVLGWLRLRRTALIAAAVSTLGTAALFFGSSFGRGDDWGCRGIGGGRVLCGGLCWNFVACLRDVGLL